MITQQTFNDIMDNYILKDTYRYHLNPTVLFDEKIYYSYLYLPKGKEYKVDYHYDDVRQIVIAILPPAELCYNKDFAGVIFHKYMGLDNKNLFEFLKEWAEEKESITITKISDF